MNHLPGRLTVERSRSLPGRDGGGVFWQAADGSGPVERLTQGGSLFPSGFSPDALHLLFSTSGVPRVASDIAMIAPGKSDHPTPLMHTSFGESNGEVSPNGRWIAYQSDESGRAEVYLRPFPDVEAGRWQVSTNGGERPLWARNGRELFYVTPGGLMTVLHRADQRLPRWASLKGFSTIDTFSAPSSSRAGPMTSHQTASGSLTIKEAPEESSHVTPRRCSQLDRRAEATSTGALTARRRNKLLGVGSWRFGVFLLTREVVCEVPEAL